MTDEFDYAAFVKQHRAKFVKRLEKPDFGDFETKFGVRAPASLKQLYALTDALIDVPVTVEVSASLVEIQSFTPMDSTTIEACSKYDWKFFEFAVGSENESLLFPLHGSEKVHVDHEGNGQDVEQTDIDFEKLLDQLRKTGK
jgi:hypothetical protein